jgi:hypothetical protein
MQEASNVTISIYFTLRETREMDEYFSSYVDPLLDNESEISGYTTAVPR